MINGALEVGFLLLQRQISLSALLSIMVTYYIAFNVCRSWESMGSMRGTTIVSDLSDQSGPDNGIGLHLA